MTDQQQPVFTLGQNNVSATFDKKKKGEERLEDTGFKDAKRDAKREREQFAVSLRK
jgi:hypothetical protein